MPWSRVLMVWPACALFRLTVLLGLRKRKMKKKKERLGPVGSESVESGVSLIQRISRW